MKINVGYKGSFTVEVKTPKSPYKKGSIDDREFRFKQASKEITKITKVLRPDVEIDWIEEV